MSPAWALDGGGSGATPTPLQPPATGLVFWVKGDAGVHETAGAVTAWDDQGSLGQNLDASNAGKEPTIGSDTLDGVPGIVYPLGATTPGSTDPTLLKFLGRASNLLSEPGVDFGIDTGDHSVRSVMAVIRPQRDPGAATNLTGGTVVNFRQQGVSNKTFSCMFFLQAFFNSFEPIWVLYSTDGPYGVFRMNGPDTPGSTFEDQPLLVEWLSTYPALAVNVNGAPVTLTPSAIAAGQADATTGAADGFVVGGQNLGTVLPNFQGAIFEVIVWNYDLSTDPVALAAARAYFAQRYPSIPVVV